MATTWHRPQALPTPVCAAHTEAGLSAGIWVSIVTHLRRGRKKIKGGLTGSRTADAKQQDPIGRRGGLGALVKTVQPVLQGCIRSYNNKFPAQKSFKCNMRQLCTLFSHLSYSWYQPTHSLTRLRSFCKTFWVQTLLSDGSLLLFPVVSSVTHGVHWTNI